MVAMMNEEYQDYIKEVIEKMADVGEEKVDPELSKLRIENGCKGCPFNEESEVFPALVAPTCNKCGCIIEILSKFNKHRDLKTMKVTDKKCERWKEIDHKYNSLSKGYFF